MKMKMEMKMKKPENKTNAVSSSCFSEVSRAEERGEKRNGTRNAKILREKAFRKRGERESTES